MDNMRSLFLVFRNSPEGLNLSGDEALDEFMADNGLSSKDPDVIELISELHRGEYC